MHHITEDTPPDMLAGAMDLSVRLPDGTDVNMAVERSTPMMDLLVQVTTAYKLRPSDHIIQALDMSERERALPYKPNTPIGALDTQRIRVLPKGRPPAPRVPPPPGHQPFESTFRLQVHLPRNQFCVIRVGKFVLLEDIMKKVCEEKNLDPRKYEFRHPANIDKVLDPKRTLNDYEITEITVVHRGTSTHLSQPISSNDIMALQREEERRKLQAKTGGGVLNLIFRRGKTSMGSGSVSSDTRSISPTQSDDSRSVTPPAVQAPILPPIPQEVKQPLSRPKPPQRKRRPAPKPPTQPPPPATAPVDMAPPAQAPELQKCQQEVTAKLENGLTICHSRNSSDSSGYHEASILSDNCTTLPRRPKSTVINTSLTNSTLSVDTGVEFSKSTGNLTNMTTQSKSTMSLTNAGRKKKAPPPPPVLKSANSVANISSSIPVVASSSDVESTPKTQDNSPPSSLSMNSDSMPKPKPRTFRTPMPVPTPRRCFANYPQDDNYSLPVNINLNPTLTNTENSGPNSIMIIDNSNNITNLTEDSEIDLPNEKMFNNMSDLDLSVKNISRNDKKERKESKISRETGFQIGKSMLTMDQDNLSINELTDASSIRTINLSSNQNISEEHIYDLEINNFEMFNINLKQKSKTYSKSQRAQTSAEIFNLQQNKTYEEVLSKTTNNELSNNDSVLSLRSFKSIPAFMGNDINIKKWGNMQNLDEDNASLGSSHHWVIGDSDTDSICPATSSDLTSFPRTSNTSLRTSSLTSFSQDSISIQQSTRSNMTTPDISTSENLPESLYNFTSTPIHSQITQLTVEEDSITEQSKEITTQEVSIETKIEAEKNQINGEINIDTERKKSIIEFERRHSAAENERKHLAIKGEKFNESETVTQKEKLSISVKEVEEKVIETRVNLTDTQKLDPINIPKQEEQEELEPDWQYTLPSPPTAFRDSSPTNFTDMTNYDTITFNGLTSGSVVSNPALFEKLESIRDTRSETETIVSEVESSVSCKQEEVLTSKYLNLENLEKRKSLVLERELASLKIAQNETETNVRNINEVDNTIKAQRDSLRHEIEEVIQQKKSGTLSRNNSQTREKILLSATDSTLPNFKITTYDQPKSKINIFEDDSIRSNVENKSANTSNRNSIADLNKILSNDDEELSFIKKRNSLISTSTENMFFAKRNSVDDFLFKKPQDPPKYKKQTSVTNLYESTKKSDMGVVSRSESFSTKNNFWSRSNPVKRSKSHISLDKYKDENKKSVEKSEEGLHKSNSLFNVSGLQSLEVMRMILPKLGNSPPSTPTEDPKQEALKLSPPKQEPSKIPLPKQEKQEPLKTTVFKQEPPFVPPKPEPIEKKYQYSGPPAINLGTWSDRPKSQVSIKEDQDYKISNISAIKSKFNLQTSVNTPVEVKKPQENTQQQNFSGINIRVNGSESKDQMENGKINIRINSDPPKTISHKSSGNVIIKIGNNNESAGSDTINQVKTEGKLRENNFYSRFLTQATAVGYRKPLGNINGVDKPRPHSIAFDANCPDLSRVPIVRAVELKKPYKDTQGNKSVTQIIHDNNNALRHSSVYLSSENLNKIDQNGQNKVLSLFPKPITRGNSFASSRTNANPVVKGFRVPINKETEIETTKQYGTLPAKSNFRTIDTNVQNFVPFSQNTLKRTENSIITKQQPEKSIFEKVVLRKTATNGLPIKRHSVGPVVETNGSAAPPPPPQMPKITAFTKKFAQRQLSAQDPRDQLLESIRNFGGKSGLRAVK